MHSLLCDARQMAKEKGYLPTLRHTGCVIFGMLQNVLNYKKKSQYHDQKIHIAFCVTGGLGDYIISAKLLEELQTLCECQITVFCEKEKFGAAVYRSRKGVDLKPYQEFEWKRNQYDLALLIEHFVHVKNWDEKRVRTLSHKLYQSIRYICDHWETLYVDIPQQCFRERIWFERCRVLGLNRYTELRMGRAFQIADQCVKIPMQESYQKIYEKLKPQKRYITINYGTDVMKKGAKQLKMWPKEYHEAFVKQMKQEMPEIQIVQLGAADAEKIDEVDVYLFGESLELIKWILLNSECHIDCEGGLVHLATQLGTKCIVIFGPTPLHMYGYEQNINLQSRLCSNCMGLHAEWAYRCYRTGKEAEEIPICMKDITPNKVCRICLEELQK